MLRTRILGAAAAATLLAACGGHGAFRSFASARDAACTLIEASRAGDEATQRTALVARERERDITWSFRDVTDYVVEEVRVLDERNAVVVMRMMDSVLRPFVCEREHDGWRVSMTASLQMVRQQSRMTREPPAPR